MALHELDNKESNVGMDSNDKPESNMTSAGIASTGPLTTFFGMIRNNKAYRMRCLHTASVVWMFITLGLLVSMVGGAFPDLRLIIQKDLETASWIFTTNAIGHVVGAFVVGVMFDRLNRLLVMIGVTVLNGVSFIIYPWCSTFPTMLVISFINSLFGGGMNCCGNAHVASIWGTASAPFMQAIHFGFSFGGFIGPLIAGPFIAQKTCILQNTTIINTTSTPNASNECVEVYGETHVQYAFLISGAISLSAALPFVIMYCLPTHYNAYVFTPFQDADVRDNKETIDKLPVLSLVKKVLFVTLLMLLISNYACLEARFSTLLTTFLSDYLDWSTSIGLHLTSLFWGTFAAGRLLGIVVTKYLKSETMILICLLAITVSFIAFLFAAEYAIRELVWACTAMAGLSMSVVFPSVFTWTAESILKVTGTISSIYIIGVSVFNTLLPLLYGYLMDTFTQLYFVYLLIAEAVFTLVVYMSIRCLIKTNH